jgi:hypothetical protein
MTETLLVALFALITAMFASMLLGPSSRSAEAFLQVQWPGGQARRATLFGVSPHAITECGR